MDERQRADLAEAVERSLEPVRRGVAWVLVPLALGAFLIFGGYWTLRGARTVYRCWASQSWPTVEGIVVRSWVLEEVSRSPGGRPGRRGASRPSTTYRLYRPVIEYHYAVNGRKYEAWMVRLGLQPGGEPYAREVVARYPPESKVVVHYDPASPAWSVLEPGVLARDFIPLGFGLVFMAVPVLLGIAFWRRRKVKLARGGSPA